MHNRRFVIPGILLFLAVFSLPFWVNIPGQRYTRPALALPAGETECVESTEFMRAEHMRLLDEWRDAAMRDGKRAYRAANGKLWTVSLQNTCMRCHTDKAGFCDACHVSNSVAPYCWSCHVAPPTPAARGTL